MNAKELGNQPVSPSISTQAGYMPNTMNPIGYVSSNEGALTKRELFAAMAMQGLLSDNDNASDIGELCFANAIATAALTAADALLAELAEEPQP